MVDYKKIRALMCKKDIKNKELAAAVGVSEAMMTYVAKGLREPSVAVLSRIAKELGCSTGELIIEEDAEVV